MNTASEVITNMKAQYDLEGWCKAPDLVSAEDIAKLRASVDRISSQIRREVVYEEGTEVVRAIHGCHLFDETCARLIRLPALIGLAEELIGEPVYVYQFKVNLKQPREGAAWPWHQDYAFWLKEDGMPADTAVNIAIFLDDVHRDNGPLQVIPGSHRLGLIEDEAAARAATGNWRRHVSADLEYTIPAARAKSLAAEHGKRAAIGPQGTYYAFHPSIVHSSSSNLSADRRAMLLVTYNAVSNAPAAPTRPEFLVGRDTSPIIRLDLEAEL